MRRAPLLAHPYELVMVLLSAASRVSHVGDQLVPEAPDDRSTPPRPDQRRAIGLGPGPAASPARREELCRIVVEQVVVDDREVRQIVWTPPARPYFADASAGAWYPQADSNR